MTASMCQSGSVIDHSNRKGPHHADYDNWHRPGQERIFRFTERTNAESRYCVSSCGVSKVLAFFANLPVCLIGMEACGSAHHWARKLQALGHTVRLMAPQFVKPYVKSNKNDMADAQAICEARAALSEAAVWDYSCSLNGSSLQRIACG
jgi:hypothetical protein